MTVILRTTWMLLAVASILTVLAIGPGSAVAQPMAVEDAGHKVAPGLARVLAATDEQAKHRVIVSVREEHGGIPGDRSVVDEVLARVRAESIEGSVETAFVAWLTGNEIVTLAADARVSFVEEVKLGWPAMEDSIEITDAITAWLIDVDGTNLTGAGQTIAIVDSGIDFMHPDLVGKNSLGGMCQLDCPDDISGDCHLNCDAYDTLGHGTHIAGITAANGDITGIAKDAKLISLRVFSGPGDYASALEITNALIWCREHAEEYNISVVSISIGGTQAYDHYCSGFVETKIGQLANDYNIATVVAAGNSGRGDGISWPACASRAIPVGATRKDDTRWAGSNYGDLVEMFAPGASILSTCRGGGYCYKTGTSMATPMMAGAVAILNQGRELDGHGSRSMHPKEVIEPLLFRHADPIVDLPYESWRRLNVFETASGLLCRADISADGVVGMADVLAVLRDWGSCAVACPADFTLDGVVDFEDLLSLLGAWGPCQF